MGAVIVLIMEVTQYRKDSLKEATESLVKMSNLDWRKFNTGETSLNMAMAIGEMKAACFLASLPLKGILEDIEAEEARKAKLMDID
jgi:putative sterol carrier protein